MNELTINVLTINAPYFNPTTPNIENTCVLYNCVAFWISLFVTSNSKSIISLINFGASPV